MDVATIIATELAKQTGSGIPRLWEWGGLVTFMFIVLIAVSGVALMFYIDMRKDKKEQTDAMNKTATALESLIELIKVVLKK